MKDDSETRLLPWIYSHTCFKWAFFISLFAISAAMVFYVRNVLFASGGFLYLFVEFLFTLFCCMLFGLMRDPAKIKRHPDTPLPQWSLGGRFITCAVVFLLMLACTVLSAIAPF